MKKKKERTVSSASGEEQEETQETKSELSKQQENILIKRQKYAHHHRHSSSSDSEAPVSPGLALSYEMRNNELFKSQERLEEKRCPPPVLPKPKHKPKPKLPVANKNGATSPPANSNGSRSPPANSNESRSPPANSNGVFSSSANKSPINNQAMQDIANEISQIKLHNNKKLAKSSSSDSDSVDGHVFTKQEIKALPKIPKKPVQYSKSSSLDEVKPIENSKPQKSPKKSKKNEGNSVTDKMNGLIRQNKIYFEETDGYSKMDDSSEPSREETSSTTTRDILNNIKEKGANLVMNKKRVLQNMCWPLGCQNGDNNNGQEEEDPLYSTVNFAALGYNNGTGEGTYKDAAELNTTECPISVYPNPTYCPNPSSKVSQNSPPKNDLTDVIQISPELGIKEVQSVVNGAKSYTVGENRDLYSLPIKQRSSSDDTGSVPTSGKSTPEVRTPEKNTPTKNFPLVLTPDDLYSQPIKHSPDKMRNSISDSDKYDIDAVEDGGYYAETALFDETPTKSKSQYDIPGLMVETSPTKFDLKPPNFKPPPPPSGGSPLLRRKNKEKTNPPVVLRNKDKIKSPKKMALKDHDSSPTNFLSQMKRSQSESDLTSEPIFASPSSIGIPTEDNNNNRHSMFVTPKEVGKLREYFIYSDEALDDGKQSGKLPHDITFPAIVPPPPSSTEIIDANSMVAPPPPRVTENTKVGPPPPPMYPPPRLHHSEKAMKKVNSDSDESEWKHMVEKLPPPPPDLLES